MSSAHDWSAHGAGRSVNTQRAVPDRNGVHRVFLARFMMALGVACVVWSLALPSDARTVPVVVLSVWGAVAVWTLPAEDTVPVVLLCVSPSTAELPGFPLSEMGPLVVVALWIGRSLLGDLLPHREGSARQNASIPLIVAILVLLTCNLVVMGYMGIATTDWIKNALPWLLCLTAYPAVRFQWTEARLVKAVETMAFVGAAVAIADIVQFTRGGGVAGSAELGGDPFISILPLLAVVGIVFNWEREIGTAGSIIKRLFLLAAFAACVARIAMSLQRAWLIGAVVGLFVWIWTDRRQYSSRMKRFASTGALVAGLVVALALIAPASQLVQNAYHGFMARIGRSWVGGSFDYSIGTRLVEMNAALINLQSSPFFGTGLGSFISYVRPDGTLYSVDYVHVGPVFVLVKLGIVGLGVLLWLTARVALALKAIQGHSGDGSPYLLRFLYAELAMVGTLFIMTRYIFKPTNTVLVWLLIGMALSQQAGTRQGETAG